MKKVVYVTGCLGFIGSYITRACLNEGWFVRGVDKETYAANKNLLKEFEQYSNFIYENKDINDLQFLYDCDYIINTAAETHVDNSIANNTEFIKSNVNGVHNLLELLRKNRTERVPVLLHFSTDEVYGDIEEGTHSEKSLLKPSNPYSASKAAADQLILAWSRTYKIPYVIVRPTNNYGINQYTEKLIPKSIKYLLLNRKIPLHNKGTPKRMWLHVEDTASAVITIIKSGVKYDIFNISGNQELQNIEVVKEIIKCYFNNDRAYFEDDHIDFSYNRAGMDCRYSVDDSKIKKLGWTSKKDFFVEIQNIVNSEIKQFRW